MSWTLVEPCCGSFALTLHLLGARRSVVPYQGSKWRLRQVISDQVRLMGFAGAPSLVVLSDAGPWGSVAEIVLRADSRRELIGELRVMSEGDPRSWYDRLHRSAPSRRRVTMAAEFLFLQRLAFSGKAVGLVGGVWVSPGFNLTSAYGKAATEVFGRINPMVPSLIRVLESYTFDPDVVSWQGPAEARTYGRSLVYIDPPYAGATGYPCRGMSRYELIAIAEGYAARGSSVIISEAEPVTVDGWRSAQIGGSRPGDGSPFKCKQEEWLTFRASQ